MTGSIGGNILGILFFTYFQLAGLLVADFCLKDEKPLAKLTVGSAMGSLAMQWLCVLTAFVTGFDITGHMVAAAIVLPVYVAAWKNKTQPLAGCGSWIKENRLFTLLFSGCFVLWCLLLDSHIIPLAADGAIHTGQCTYGDMNMHLGFITSIANQSRFPPVYSIFPDTKLAYPFLNASISSSIWLFGSSLRLAYILPMLTAFFQVCGGVYMLAETALGDKAKALLAWVLLFFNGGLGFVYFTGLVADSSLTFKDIFTGFYTTPTNLIDFNIRWANIIADILLPQRASLFGYAILFSGIWLLYRSVWQDKDRYFVLAAIFAGSLPLIHTHSFLAMGLISASWLLLWLYRRVNPAHRWNSGVIFACFIMLMQCIQIVNRQNPLPSQIFYMLGLSGIGLCIIYGIWLMIKHIKTDYRKLLTTWGVYLVTVMAIALPQLVLWTFGQVAEGGFLRGHFNWGNLSDNYLWFYIKNIGAPLVLIIPAICKADKTRVQFILPAGVIWFVAELIMFTPNTYDNNKLLYVAYMLLCIAAADYGTDLYRSHKNVATDMAAVVFVGLCTVSALLTLGRETVSDYVLYSADHVALAEYIEQNTDTEDVILTDTRHNNEIASLTGRSIVCGSDVFLYYHGIDTSRRKAQVVQMYQRPADNPDLYEKYSVDYVVISSWERNNYRPADGDFDRLFEKVFENSSVKLYKVRKSD
ncbi:MAG: hypothetical protein IKJ05_07200 [Oscillospiraceae bacterium]|nr:hypothetical protein [Oscillospiraceae bacterium]